MLVEGYDYQAIRADVVRSLPEPTRRKAAEHVGLSEDTFRQIWHGRPASLSSLMKIANKFGRKLSDYYKGV